MKFAELKVDTIYAVIPSWDYSSADKKNADTVQRRSVAKAELVSLDKYEYAVFRSETQDSANFKPAQKGARSVGYLVRSLDWAGNVPDHYVYWLSRPQDIVAEYSTLESRWLQQEQEEKKREEERRAQQLEEERKEREAHEYAQRIVDSCSRVLQSILGERMKNVSASVSRRRDSSGNYVPHPEFILDGRTMQYLAEKILEAEDKVA
jgi:hypothetical protein